jgi:NADP-dependent 3-hydroxy acid dehydrogenase YdfG
MNLAGAVGLVTGGTSGIGAAVVRQCAARGARVSYCARRARDTSHDDETVFFRADVLDYDALVEVCAAVTRRWGRIDFVVTAAGLAHQGTLTEGNPDVWRQVVRTNVLGTAYPIRAAAPGMCDRASGHVVLVSSVAGRSIHPGEPIYLASKWAVAGMGHTLRRELRPHGVRVTLIEPGLVDTPMARSSPKIQEWLAHVDPLQADDVAAAIVNALEQPDHVSINEVLMRPSAQEV